MVCFESISFADSSQDQPAIKEIKYKINIRELDTKPEDPPLSDKVKQKIIDQIVKGFGMWNNLEGVGVRFVYDGLTDSKYKDNDNVNVIHVTMDDDAFKNEQSRIRQPDAKAIIRQRGEKFDILTHGMAYLGFGKVGRSDEYVWFVNFPSTMGSSLTMVMAHEAGHALGLGHDDSDDSIMNPVERRKLIKLSDDDKRRVRELHPLRTESRSPSVTPPQPGTRTRTPRSRSNRPQLRVNSIQDVNNRVLKTVELRLEDPPSIIVVQGRNLQYVKKAQLFRDGKRVRHGHVEVRVLEEGSRQLKLSIKMKSTTYRGSGFLLQLQDIKENRLLDTNITQFKLLQQ